MKISLKEIKISEIVKGYKDDNENGVVGYDGLLNIRPAYQREFVYKDKQRDAVINTVRNGFPLNVMYWAKNADNTYEVLDGQQRTISICQYVKGDFAIEYRYFHNLTDSEKKEIENYKLMVYICEGTDKEKLDWFKTINIAGVKLTDQELLNAVYTGTWLSDAKKYFSKKNCVAYNLAKDYVKGDTIRQEVLEVALSWISNRDDITIEEYMAKHQHDNDASDLWQYFQHVINWVKIIYPNYRKEMKGVKWGLYYNKFKDTLYNSNELEKKVSSLMQDEDVTNKSGIYEYLLDGEEKHLSIRSFSDKDKREAYEKQGGICPDCKKHYEIDEMEADHIDPWAKGGRTISSNCKMRCKHCNRRKSDI